MIDHACTTIFSRQAYHFTSIVSCTILIGKEKTLFIIFDREGHCRVISGYYDGCLLHVQITRILDFSAYATVPPTEIPYLDSINKEKFYTMMNILLKWTWPIALGITNKTEDIPVTVNRSRDDHQEGDVIKGSPDDWVLV